MIDKRITNAQLKEKAGFSANIITRLKRNEYISIESVERICRVLECGADDISNLLQKTTEEKPNEPERTYQRKSRPHLGDCR